MSELSGAVTNENVDLTEQKSECINSPTEIITNIVEQTLVDLVKKSLENEDMKTKINITPEVISIINNIISFTPNTLTDIEKAIIEIIKDGKIDMNDIPKFIIVVQNIYQFIYSLKTMKFDFKQLAKNTGEVLKYLISVLVIEKKIQISDEPEKLSQFYTQINFLIDSCVELLCYSKSIKTKGCLKHLHF